MKLSEFKSLVMETVSEVMREKLFEGLGLPPSSIVSLDTFVQGQQEIDESDMLGAMTTPVNPDELQGYIKRSVGDPQFYKKTGEPKLDKKGNQKYASMKTATDKYKYPFIHASNVEIKDEKNRLYDLDKLKAAIMLRPEKILKQNEKIMHSGGGSTIYYNVGLPALKGLAVNEKTGEFVVVDTCPGAGACKVYCYAKKGGYVQWKASSMSQTKQLNFLLNDPEGYKNKLKSEISTAQASYGNKGTKVVIRWHDAGDFFSPDYMNLAYSIARDFPDVDFYAYTKMASVALGSKPVNFKTNFSSGGATPEQETQVGDLKKVKHGVVVPVPMFADYVVKKGPKMEFKSPEALQMLKQKLSSRYDVSVNNILTYDEMMAIPAGTEPKYHVIVKQGDGDDSANRADVVNTMLLKH